MKKRNFKKDERMEAIDRACRVIGLPRKEILSCAVYDLDAKGRRVDGITAVCTETTYSVESGKIVREIPNCEIEQFEFDDGFGCSMIVAVKKNGEGITICRSDMKFREMYVSLAGEMTEKATHHPPKFGSSRKIFVAKSGGGRKGPHGGGFGPPPPNGSGNNGGANKRSGKKGKVVGGIPTGGACPKCGRPYRPGSSKCDKCDRGFEYLKWLWGLISDYKLGIFGAVLLFFTVTGLNLIVPYLNRIMVDDYIKSENIDISLLGFAYVLVAILVLNIIVRIISTVRSLLMNSIGAKVTVKMRQLIFEKIQKLSLSGINRMTTGELMHRITRDSRVVKEFLTSDFSEMVEQLLTFVGVIIMLFIFDYKLAFMLLLPVPFVLIFWRLFSKKTHRIYDRQWQFESHSRSILQDIFSGIRVVKSYGSEQSEISKYDNSIKDELDIQIKNETFFGKVLPLISFFMGFGEFFLLFYGGNLILNGSMTLGEMMQFSSYASMIYGPLRWMSHLPRKLFRLKTSVSRIYDVIEDDDMLQKGSEIDLPIKGDIVFDHVGFGYESGNAVFDDVCVHIKPGEMIGIVGRSGIGKSTMINLIMRMYDVDKGRILIDGVDIRDLSEHSLRSQIGAVLQDTFLFSGTVYDNITYAKPDATVEEVISASKIAGVHKFIIKMQDGYNTYIGEHGYTLSGGERQRVAIARAILRDPRILILDEATSALDTQTEKEIQDALQVLAKGRTVIAIAHRLSTLRNCDRIIVLSDGKIVQQGKHDELMREDGIYSSLVLAQRQMFRIGGKDSKTQK